MGPLFILIPTQTWKSLFNKTLVINDYEMPTGSNQAANALMPSLLHKENGHSETARLQQKIRSFT